jgi:type I restriction enzyme S subunit
MKVKKQTIETSHQQGPPNSWKIASVGELCEVVNGRGFKPHEWKRSGYPIIRIQNLNGSEEYNYFEGEFDKKILVKKGQLLFAWSGSKGTSFGPHLWNGPTGLLNYHTWKINVKSPLIDKGFFLQYLRIITTKIESKAHGASALVHTQKGEMEAFEILLPQVSEQRAIASLLFTWDRSIELITQLIAKKELHKKWLMQQLLLGKKRLTGFRGEWRLEKLNKFASEVSLRNKEDFNLTVLSCTKYDGLVPSLEYFGRKIFSDDLSTYKIVPKNHFAYATNHIEEGSIGYQSQFDKGLISPMYTVFKTNDEINDGFLFRVLKTHNYILEYKKRMEGSIDRRGGLRWEEFSKIPIPVLSMEEQVAITKVLQSADTELNLLRQKLDKLKEQKKGLMQILLTGKKRLKLNK